MLTLRATAIGNDTHPQLINVGRQPVKEAPDCSFFDSITSFDMIRGEHIDATGIRSQ